MAACARSAKENLESAALCVAGACYTGAVSLQTRVSDVACPILHMGREYATRFGRVSWEYTCAGAGVVRDNLSFTAAQIKKFLEHKDNRKKVVLYIIAWAIIIVLLGVLASGVLSGRGGGAAVTQGFSRVSLPLTIGFAPGALVGGIISVVVRKILKAQPEEVQHKWSKRNTLWKLVSGALEEQDEGTRKLVYAVVISVLVSAAVLQPYALGAVFGLVLMNHATTIIPEWVAQEGKKLKHAAPVINDLGAQDDHKTLADLRDANLASDADAEPVPVPLWCQTSNGQTSE